MEDIEAYSDYSSDEDNQISSPYNNHQQEEVLESRNIQQLTLSEFIANKNSSQMSQEEEDSKIINLEEAKSADPSSELAHKDEREELNIIMRAGTVVKEEILRLLTIKEALLKSHQEEIKDLKDIQSLGDQDKKRSDMAQQITQAIEDIESEYNEIRGLYGGQPEQELKDSQWVDLQQKLKNLGFRIEKVRVNMDQAFYPRDYDLRVIDVKIQDDDLISQMPQSYKKVVIRDLFAAYDRCLEYQDQLKDQTKLEAAKEEERSTFMHDEFVFVGQNQPQDQDILGLTEIDIATARNTVLEDFIEQQNNKPQPKNRITKMLGFGNQQEGQGQVNLVSVAKRFYPALQNQDDIISSLETVEFNFVFKMQRISLQSYELELNLISVDTNEKVWKYQQMSQTGIIECKQLPMGRMSNPNFMQVFVNLSLSKFLTEDVSLMIKVISKKESVQPANVQTTLDIKEGNATHRYVKAFHFLPISKLLWANALRVGDSYFVQHAPMYLVPENMQIEPNYLEMMQNRKLRKSKDTDMTQAMGMNYLYKIEDKNFVEKLGKYINDDRLTMVSEVGINIVRGLDFEKLMLKSNHADYINYLKYKLNKYPFNELKLHLKNVVFTDILSSKSQVFRLEIALRDNLGNVYQSFYRTMCDINYSLSQTYESLIYPAGQHDTRFNEHVFMRIPTRGLENLKKLNMCIMLQTLTNVNDSKGKTIKMKRLDASLTTMQFKTEYIGMIPLFDTKTNQILGGDMDYSIKLYKFKGKHQIYIPPTFDAMYPHIESSGGKIVLSSTLISTEFTLNQTLNCFFQLKNDSSTKDIELYVRSIEENRDQNELILMHEKILDKLFTLVSMTQNLRDTKIPHYIFRAIISIFDVFDNHKHVNQIYSDILESYIDQTFNYPRLYIFLIQQLEHIAPVIARGITIIESTTGQGQHNHPEEAKSLHNGNDDIESGPTTLRTIKNLHYILLLVKKSFEQNLRQNLQGVMHGPEDLGVNSASQMSPMIKKITSELGTQLQKPLLSIFETCHLDRGKHLSKAVLTLRGYLYQNLTMIIESISNIVEPEFLQTLMTLLSKKQKNARRHLQRGDITNPRQTSDLEGLSSSQLQQIRRENQSTTNNNLFQLLPSFFGERFFHNPYENVKWVINQEALTQILVINVSMLLRSEVLRHLKFILLESIVRFFKKFNLVFALQKELRLHVHYFFYEFSKYIFSIESQNSIMGKEEGSEHTITQEQVDFIKKQQQDAALLIFTFYGQSLHQTLKNTHLEREIQTLGIPDTYFTPFKDKVSLVYLESTRHIKEAQIEVFVSSCNQNLFDFLSNLHRLIKSVSFKDNFNQYFEVRKLRIILKLFQDFTKILIDRYPKAESLTQKGVIFECIESCLNSLLNIAQLSLSLQKKHQAKYKELGILEEIVHSDDKINDMNHLTERIFKQIRFNWTRIKSCVHSFWKIVLNVKLKMKFVKIFKLDAAHNKSSSAFLIQQISDCIEKEYQESQQIQASSNFIMQILYELSNSQIAREGILQMFAQKMQYIQVSKMCTLIQSLIKKMQLLNQDIQAVNLCYEKYPNNTLCLGASLAQLSEQIFKINFPVEKILSSISQLNTINSRLDNTVENACISENIVKTIQAMSDKDKSKLGEKEIIAQIISKHIRDAQTHYTKARFYQKSIEILDIQRNLYANQLYDYSKASAVHRSIAELYTQMSQDGGHHFCEYYKLGFYGTKIPAILRNKEYIFRGVWPKRLLDLKNFLSQQFEGAKWLDNSSSQLQEIQQSNESYISIIKLIPLTFFEIKEFGFDSKTSDKEELSIGTFFPSLPQNMKKYYLENFKNKFYTQITLDSVSSDSAVYEHNYDQIIKDLNAYSVHLPEREKDLKSLVEEMMRLKGDREIDIFKVKYKFPFSFCMQEVCKTKRIKRKAIDEAIRSTQKMLNEIQHHKQQLIDSENDSDVEFFLLQVEATINSKVSGGVQRYFLSFITQAHLENPKTLPKCLALYENLKQIGGITEESIRVLQKHSAAEGRLQVVESAYRDLQKNFIQTAKTMIEKMGPQGPSSTVL